MATIAFTLSAAHLTRTVDALGARWGYQTLINGQPNPQSKSEFVRLKIAAVIRSEVRAHEVAEAQAVTAGAITDIDVT